jgi:hypothetical protein
VSPQLNEENARGKEKELKNRLEMYVDGACDAICGLFWLKEMYTEY